MRPTSPGQSLPAQFAGIAKQLSEVATDPLQSIAAQEYASQPHGYGADKHSEEKRQLSSLEASLAVLPDEPCFHESRAGIMKRIAELRVVIANSRPLGARIDGCRAALARAKNRLSTAESADQAAQMAKKTAALQVQTIESELKEPEASVVQETK